MENKTNVHNVAAAISSSGIVKKIRNAVHIKCDERVFVFSCTLRSFPNVKYLMKWLFPSQLLLFASLNPHFTLFFSCSHFGSYTYALATKTSRKKSTFKCERYYAAAGLFFFVPSHSLPSCECFTSTTKTSPRVNDGEENPLFRKRQSPPPAYSCSYFKARISLIILHNSYHLSTRIFPRLYIRWGASAHKPRE